MDLCAGPHLMSTGAVKAVKLTPATSAPTGASSRDSLPHVRHRLPQGQRAGGGYLKQQEEALKRDHNKIARELEYFAAVDNGQGLPVIRRPRHPAAAAWVEDTEQKRGYLLTKTP